MREIIAIVRIENMRREIEKIRREQEVKKRII